MANLRGFGDSFFKTNITVFEITSPKTPLAGLFSLCHAKLR